MFFILKLLTRNALRQKLRMSLTLVGLVVAISAFGLLRTIVDAWYAGVDATSSVRLDHAQLDLAGVPAAAQLRPADAPGRRRDRRVVGQLVRRRLHQRAQLLPAVRRRRRELPRHVSRIRAAAGRAEGVPRGSTGRRRRPQARRPLRLEGRRPDPAARHDLSPARGRSRCAASTTGSTRRPTRRSSSFNGPTSTRPSRSATAAVATRSASTSSGCAIPTTRPTCRIRSTRFFGNSLAETLTETEKAFQLGFVSMTELILIAIQAVSLRRHPDHHGGDGEHDRDDGARAHGRVRDAEGARLRARVHRLADRRRVAGDRAGRRRRRDRGDVPDRERVRRSSSARCSRSSRCRARRSHCSSRRPR